MTEFLRSIGGMIPARVRYCEVDGSIFGRDARTDQVRDWVVREVAPLHGFFTGA
ncbi:MAG: hypothetical protein ABR584_04935 [Candidatus Baltobacteraceae bacterium]